MSAKSQSVHSSRVRARTATRSPLPIPSERKPAPSPSTPPPAPPPPPPPPPPPAPPRPGPAARSPRRFALEQAKRVSNRKGRESPRRPLSFLGTLWRLHAHD